MKEAAIVVCKLNGWEWPEELGEPPDWIIEKFKLSGKACYEYEKERYAELMNIAKSYTSAKRDF